MAVKGPITRSVFRTIRACKGWLGPEHASTIEMMKLTAAELDKEPNAALIGQLRLLTRTLLDAKPAAVESDPLTAILERANE